MEAFPAGAGALRMTRLLQRGSESGGYAALQSPVRTCSVMVGGASGRSGAGPAVCYRPAAGGQLELLSFHRMLFDGYRLAFRKRPQPMLQMHSTGITIRLLEAGGF